MARAHRNRQGSSNDASGRNGAPSGKQGRSRCSIGKESGHKWFKCSKRVCSIYRETGHDPNSCRQAVNEAANPAISDDAVMSSDKLDGICEYIEAEYVLDALFIVSEGKLFGPDYYALRGWRHCVASHKGLG